VILIWPHLRTWQPVLDLAPSKFVCSISTISALTKSPIFCPDSVRSCEFQWFCNIGMAILHITGKGTTPSSGCGSFEEMPAVPYSNAIPSDSALPHGFFVGAAARSSL
jgi:hypothetical protein